MSNHTWIVRRYCDAQGTINNLKIWSSDEFSGELICVIPVAAPENLNEQYSRARLIATAPDLLATLREIARAAGHLRAVSDDSTVTPTLIERGLFCG